MIVLLDCSSTATQLSRVTLLSIYKGVPVWTDGILESHSKRALLTSESGHDASKSSSSFIQAVPIPVDIHIVLSF